MDPGVDRRVLVVEDEPLSAELVRVLLEDMGCEVSLARTGAEAVRLATSQRYAMILMDYFLPVMSGLDAARRIRAAHQAAGGAVVPIIALTASDNRADHRACLEAGMNGCLLKPLDSRALRATLDVWGLAPDGDPGEAVPPSVAAAGFDPIRVESLRGAIGEDAFDAVVEQALSSLSEQLRVIASAASDAEALRRAFHRIVSLSHDLGFVTLGRTARRHEEALGAGAGLGAEARLAFLDAGDEVLGRLRSFRAA